MIKIESVIVTPTEGPAYTIEVSPSDTAIIGPTHIPIDSYCALIRHPENMTYILDLATAAKKQFTNLKIKSEIGTCTLSIQIDGVAITGMDALAITSTEQSFDATALNVALADSTISFVVSSVSTIANLSFTLKASRLSL